MQLFKKSKLLSRDTSSNYFKSIIVVIIALVMSLTVGFSTFNASLDINSLMAYFIVNKDIKVSNIALNGTQNNGISNWQEHGLKTISTNIDLPNNNSSVSYEVEVTNIGNIEMGIANINGIPDNLEYDIEGYTLKSELCDYEDQSICKLGSVSKFIITFSYKNNGYDNSNTNYNIRLEFNFRRFYNISYVNLNDENLPKKAIETDNSTIQFPNPYPDRLQIVGNNNNSYNASNGILNLNDINDDITITYVTKSFFIAYDGNINLFNRFDKTNITSFERNTTLSLEQVRTKYNNNEAFIISTSYDDLNYPSNHEIYAWTQNNKLYWWSASNVVYFHPDTLNAFRLMTNVTNINLEGTNTSMVKNFSHWFDKDAKLRNIIGKINTSGLEINNTTFDFANDLDENASSETSLAYMFNDCKVLTSIDLSEFDTSNATDMKRMFGGCSNLSNLDVSGFDTTNVKSMYWMFRKNNGLHELDLRNFNTSNVENMIGMFVDSDNIETIYLGLNFNTSNVKRFTNMFYSLNNLVTIYAYNDFQTNSHRDSANMFNFSNKLTGSPYTIDSTPYDQYNITINYAKLANNGVKGYLTPYNTNRFYNITYELDGSTATNPTIYYENSAEFSLNEPYKPGYLFLGWTGSNGEEMQKNVTIYAGTTGDLHYVAHFEEILEDLFPKVFAISGSCNFNGSNSNITGETCINDLDGTSYTNSTYIDTGINLYNADNYKKDYEIYFEISNYDPNNQEVMANGNRQNTLMNSKSESESGYPGVVFRKNSNLLEIKSFDKAASRNYNTVSSIKILRLNRKVYYSFNGEDLVLINDNTSFNNPFNLSVWFGASKNSSGSAFRHSKCTLSNIYIKLGTYS